MSVNKVILLGRVGKDPEIKTFDSGTAKASFSLATTERGYTKKDGTKVDDRTEWHNIVCWAGLAQIAERFIKKGDQIYVEGRITTRSWESDGRKNYITEIVAEKIELLGGKKDGQGDHYDPEKAGPKGIIDDLDNLPF